HTATGAPAAIPTPRPMVTGNDPVHQEATPGGLASRPASRDDIRPLWRRALPWVAFAAAGGAAAGGGYYLAINNDGSECKGPPPQSCHYYNDTLWRYAVPLLAVSAALITTGVVLLTVGGRADRDASNAAQPSPAAKLAITPAGLSLFGSF
ncbi:MAG: hypothetical protein ABI560_11660, partial [Myxococcales bacterium]